MRLGRMKVEATPQVSALSSTLYHFSPLCSTFTQILLHFRDKSKHFFDTFSVQRLIFRLLRAFPVPYVVTNAKKHHILYKIWCSNFFTKFYGNLFLFSHLSRFCHFLTHCQEFFMYCPGFHPAPDEKKSQSGSDTARPRYFRLLSQGSALPAQRTQCMGHG